MDLSVLIPARNEMFLLNTINDILLNMRGETEIIVILDGDYAEMLNIENERLLIIYHTESIGQRSSTNEAARIAKGKYLMKVDAHCAFDEGFDVKMLKFMQNDWTMVPIMRNLHAFDWVCEDGHRRYQSPSGPCETCGKPTIRDVVWVAKKNPQSKSYCFDSTPHFQYFREYTKRPEFRGKNGLTETMSLQGSCFMISKDKYFELNICDEELGSWGSQGIEVAMKTWLTGGKVIVNHNTWYAHMFRTQGGDFGFPYKLSGKQTEHAKSTVRKWIFNNELPNQTLPFSWLLENFWPVPGWSEEDRNRVKENGKLFYEKKGMTDIPSSIKLEDEDDSDCLEETPYQDITKMSKKPTIGIVYYTDNGLKPFIEKACQTNLNKYKNDMQIVAVSLKPLEWKVDKFIVMDGLERGVLTMFKQILEGIKASDADIIYMCEHDVLYHPEHFRLIPPKRDVFWYDENSWHLFENDGHSLFYNVMKVSMMCAYKDLLLEHYTKRVERVEKEGFTRSLGYEPGNHPFPRGVDFYKRQAWWANGSSADIRHSNTLTRNRWKQDQFRDKSNLYAWTESNEVPGWGITKGRFNEFLQEIIDGKHILKPVFNPPPQPPKKGSGHAEPSRVLTPPPMTERLANFSKAAISHFLKGHPTCTDEEIQSRLEICNKCEFFIVKNEDTGVCAKCGCPLTAKRKFVSKLGWKDSKCPVGKWGPIP